MAFYIDEAAGRIVEVVGEAVPEPGWIVIDGDTATVCGLRSGQSVSRDQIAALREGATAQFLALRGDADISRPQAAPSPVDVRRVPANQPAPAPQVMRPGQSPWFIAAAIVAALAWAVSAVTCLSKYNDAQSRIDDAWDISAIQIQQLNGEVAAHGITALIVAMALTVPAILLKR